MEKCKAYVSYYGRMRGKEKKMKSASPDYLERVQKDGMDFEMRGLLVDWLVEVAYYYHLLPDTLYLAVSYMDRFLSEKSVTEQNLLLLGVSSLLIAAKYEETYPLGLGVEDCCFITADKYKSQEIVNMEAQLLKALDYELGVPTTRSFLHELLNFHDSSLQLQMLSGYLGELSLVDYQCLKFPPSLVAAAAMFLSRLTLDPKSKPWTDELQLYSGYKPADLKECVLMLHGLQVQQYKLGGSSLVVVREKYKKVEFEGVSTLLPPLRIPNHCFKQLRRKKPRINLYFGIC